MKEKIETLTNIIFICLAIIVGTVFVRNMMTQPSQPNISNSSDTPRVGEQLPDMQKYKWASHEQTLVLALRKGCKYCEESMPFYRNLVELKQANKISANIISVFQDPEQLAQEVIKTEKLAVDVISDTKLSNLKVNGTPTLILVDKQGKVLKSWVGKLPKNYEDQVIDFLSKRT